MAGQRNNYGKRTHSQSDYGDNRGNKRRNFGDDRDVFSIGSEDTVYRYLCPGNKIGSIIGRGGEIVKQLRVDTKSTIRIGETVSGCDERVITIHSSSAETNVFGDIDNRVCLAQDALFRVHDSVVTDDLAASEDLEGTPQVTVRLFVPSDQIGCIIGKGGLIVQNIRSETGATVRILKNDHLPSYALGSDELVQISGESRVVKKALYQIASRLHNNPTSCSYLMPPLIGVHTPTRRSVGMPSSSRAQAAGAPSTSRAGTLRGGAGLVPPIPPTYHHAGWPDIPTELTGWRYGTSYPILIEPPMLDHRYVSDPDSPSPPREYMERMLGLVASLEGMVLRREAQLSIIGFPILFSFLAFIILLMTC